MPPASAPLESPSVEAMYRRFGPMVVRRCRSILRDEAAAWDAAQDVFIAALERDASQPIEDRGLSSFFYLCATRVSLNEVRRRGRHVHVDSATWAIGTTDVADRSFLRLALGRAAADEAELTRAMAHLKYVDAFTYEDIAEMTQRSVSGVRKRLRGFKARMASRLEDQNGA